MKKFGLIGVAGYIAPRHLKAIKETGHDLVVATDVNDSVGILDSFFPEAEFFTEFERFEAYIEDEKLFGRKLDYIVICSPNYLHVSHMKFALRNGIDVICEKPLALTCGDLDALKVYEEAYGARVFSILQLRLHPAILGFRRKVKHAPSDKKFDVVLTYMTSRGKWYDRSWKSSPTKSGGLATNIGVHFYDMLHFIFGSVLKNELHYRDDRTSAGCLIYERAKVKWLLSIERSHLPEVAVETGKSTYRSILVEDEQLEFSDGFTDLHTQSYELILSNSGFSIEDNRVSIETVQQIRTAIPVKNYQDMHPLALNLENLTI